MNARDELAKLLFVTDNHDAKDPDHEWEMTTRYDPKYAEYAFTMADAILAAGYSKPRQVSTVEELDALPEGAVILSTRTGDSAQTDHEGYWYLWGGDTGLTSAEIDLPASVLYEPRP